jgi:nucleoside-diphosphate-sugar epimerase
MSTVLVTGASGFIGPHMARSLTERGDRVRALVRATSVVQPLVDLGVELVRGDLFCVDDLARAATGCDVVYHLAGCITPMRREDQMRINREGAAAIARACAAQPKPPVLVLVSSVAAAGPARHGRLRTEADRPAPLSNYGRSKRAGELAVAPYANRVPITVVRPGVVFGPRDKLLLPAFRAVDRFGVHVVPGFTSPPLSLVYVDDLVELLIRAAECGKRLAPNGPRRRFARDGVAGDRVARDGVAGDGVAGDRVAGDRVAGNRFVDHGFRGNGEAARLRAQGCYFACADEYPDYAELGRMIARSLGRRHMLVFPVTAPLPWLVGGAAELISRLRGVPQPLNVDKMREALAPSWACSAESARHDLDFTPPQPLAVRLDQTAAWYRDHGWL